jgi:thiamine-phosphate pyrophosphorylase
VILCLVTDRRRLAGAASSTEHARQCLVRQTRFAVDAGVDLVQLRERDLDGAGLASIGRDLAAITRGTATRLVINDRLDVALACGADGVHLRGDSFSIGDARRIAPPGFLVGRSVRTVDEARQAGEADYLIAGTLFPSRSKAADHPVIGVDGLRAIVAGSSRPVLAIGGIAIANLSDVSAAGAAGCAAIELFMSPDPPDATAICRAVPLGGIVSNARTRFDTMKTRP